MYLTEFQPKTEKLRRVVLSILRPVWQVVAGGMRPAVAPTTFGYAVRSAESGLQIHFGGAFSEDESAALLVMDRVCDSSLEEFCEELHEEIFQCLNNEACEHVDDFDTWRDEFDFSKFNPPVITERAAHPGPVSLDPIRCEISSVEMEVEDGYPRFTLSGSAGCTGSASVEVDSDAGGETEDHEISVDVEARFVGTLSLEGYDYIWEMAECSITFSEVQQEC